jgi:hypothetical protein
MILRIKRINTSLEKYLLEHQCVEVVITGNLEIGQEYNVRIHAQGKAMLKWGLNNIYQTACNIVESLGGSITKERLNRMDLCIDLPEIDMNTFINAHCEGKMVSRSNVICLYKSTSPSLMFGKAPPVSAMFYDRLWRVRASQDAELMELMKDHRWNGFVPSCATRLEFRLAREWLREFGINTIEEYNQRRGDVFDYLTTRQIRMLNKPKTSNMSRAKYHPLWIAIRTSLFSMRNMNIVEDLKRIGPAPIADDRLLKQAYGCVDKYRYRSNMRPIERDDFMRYAREL